MTKLRRIFVYLGFFFGLMPLVYLISFFSLQNAKSFSSLPSLVVDTASLKLYTALPGKTSQLSFGVGAADARPIIIRQYLKKYHSPLSPYADDIFAASQRYRLDYRLLVAIAQQESNLGKKIPSGSYNAWGWGIHSRGTLGFSNWPEAIETVAKGLRENYLDKGYRTPEEIMTKYTPLSNGSWAFGVNQFMAEME